ncbi:MAG: nitroreductase family protein [Roseburia faecis]|nr:nitroreductase family protein [Roseburia faecis]
MANSFYEMAKERWSVRNYKDEQIKPEEMQKILEAGNYAPSACNYQPQRILVLQSKEAIETVRALTHWAFNAPTVLLICSDIRESWKNIDGADSWETDAVICTTQMMYAAWEQGIGSCWVRGIDSNAFARAFRIPDYLRIVAMMPMGYPSDNAKPSNWHWKRKQLDETVTFV